MITKEEKKVLSLPPKFGVYNKVTKTQSMIDVEEAMNKLRWNKIIAKQVNKNDGNGIDEKRYFVDPLTKEDDVQNLMARDLPFVNPSVMMPPALSMEEEIQIHHLKTEFKKIAEDMESKSKKWSNLSSEEKNRLRS